MKHKTWKHKLTARERKHLRESGINTKAQLIQVLSAQRAARSHLKHEPCFECKHIGNKLEL